MARLRYSFVFLGAFLATSSAFAGVVEGNPRVVDGDTLAFGDVRVRLDGIDAPEAGQSCDEVDGGHWRCDDAVMNKLVELVASGVQCEGNAYDGYDRLLATCVNVNGVNINELLVTEGLAWAFRKYSLQYAPQEDVARSKGIGIWQANTMPAWEYRELKWQAAVDDAPDGCPIKGNISKNGKIYHPPWSPWYNKTKVNVKSGERWFCNEKEALDAGWRAPAWR